MAEVRLQWALLSFGISASCCPLRQKHSQINLALGRHQWTGPVETLRPLAEVSGILGLRVRADAKLNLQERRHKEFWRIKMEEWGCPQLISNPA